MTRPYSVNKTKDLLYKTASRAWPAVTHGSDTTETRTHTEGNCYDEHQFLVLDVDCGYYVRYIRWKVYTP